MDKVGFLQCLRLYVLGLSTFCAPCFLFLFFCVPTARQVVTIARSLGRLQRDHGLPIDPEENIKLNLNFGLVDVVYEWARGVPFCEITQV